MTLGITPMPDWLMKAMDITMPFVSAVTDAVGGLIYGGGQGQDAADDPGSVAAGPVAADVGGASGAGGSRSGVRTSSGGGGGGASDSGYYDEGEEAPTTSAMPWLIGLGVLGLGGYIAYRVIKKRRARKR